MVSGSREIYIYLQIIYLSIYPPISTDLDLFLSLSLSVYTIQLKADIKWVSFGAVYIGYSRLISYSILFLWF